MVSLIFYVGGDFVTEKEFVEKIGKLAAEDMKTSGILASVTTAQACLESGYGTTELAKNANNLFGMKISLSGNTWTSAWDGKSKYTKKTNEQTKDGKVYVVTADFRKYADILTSIKDHSCYLNGAMNGKVKRYAGLSGCKDHKTAAQLIKNGGYATDTKYVDKLCSLIERWNLTRFDNFEKENDNMNIIDVTNASRPYIPQWGNQKRYIVVHYLGVAGQNNKINSDGCGAHYYIYWDGTIYKAADHNAILWQVGTAGYYTQKHPYARNSNCIGIEMCPKCDGSGKYAEDPTWYFTEATQNACVQLVKYLMGQLGVGTDHVLRHFDVVNKYCPAPYVTNNKYKTSWTWSEFKAKLGSTSTPTVTPSTPAQTKTYKVGMYKVNCDLHIRSDATVNSKVVNTIRDRGEYTITEIKNNCWGKLKSGAGWINVSDEYCTYVGVVATASKPVSKPTAKPATPVYKVGKYKVNCDALTIRSDASSKAGATGSIRDKGTYNITEIKNTYWGKLKSGAGWICIDKDFCTYVGALDKHTTVVNKEFQIAVRENGIRVRASAGLSARIAIGSCPIGTYTITETKTADGYTWGKLKSGAGWIAIECCVRL